MNITPAQLSDAQPIKHLLESCDLPTDDLTSHHLNQFLVCRDKGQLIGTIGLELFGSVGLLRSLAVSDQARGQGLGGRLVAAAEERARSAGITRLFLLTTTADGFFARLGYAPTDRDGVPEAIRGTAQFSTLCPSSSRCMVKQME